MLRKPGQLWLLFGWCVALILPAMIWLTVKTVRLDHEFQNDQLQTELARREAEIQEKITSALYRMDWKLGPHIAREAARPYYLYQSFYTSYQDGTNTGETPEFPSPLLYQTSEFVRLHFQVQPDNQFSSPQRPATANYCQMAMTCCGVTNQVITKRDQQLQAVKGIASYQLLYDKIKESAIFEDSGTTGIAASNQGGNSFLIPSAENFVSKFGDQIELNELPQQVLSDPNLDQKSKVQRSRGNDRGGKEFVKRQKQYVDNTSQWADNNRTFNIQLNASPDSQSANQVVEGVMRPLWIDDELFLIRKVKVEGMAVVQGCWLAWDAIENALQEEVADILPGVQFEIVEDENSLIPERALVTLPVQLVVDTQRLLASSEIKGPGEPVRTGLQMSLLLAWVGLFASVVATAALLRGVVQLSERRASFVSAVTHELRTPLTTFKMYSEMLVEKMVPPEKQILYAETLHREADRLSHLVENVLQFARLERGSQKRLLSSFYVGDLLSGIPERLAARANDSGFTLIYLVKDDVLQSRVEAEPHVLEQVLFNLVDNSCKYAANSCQKKIEIRGVRIGNTLRFSVRDFGPGIRSGDLNRIFRPFHKSDLEAANTAPGVGLGLALCKRMVTSMGGKMFVQSVDVGAKFVIELYTTTC